MSVAWTVFVEGEDDKAFLDTLLNRLGITKVNTDMIGGGVHHLRSIEPLLKSTRDAGSLIAVLLDANSDCSKTNDELLNYKNRLGLPIDRHFLVPDNSNPGSLETLLEMMAVPNHSQIYECFDYYKSCLKRLDDSYTLPDSKARIYAYCEALGEVTRGSERDYRNSDCWDLDVPALRPLKQFLHGLNPSMN